MFTACLLSLPKPTLISFVRDESVNIMRCHIIEELTRVKVNCVASEHTHTTHLKDCLGYISDITYTMSDVTCTEL